MHKTLWKDVLCNRTFTRSRREQRAHLRLHVRRETRITFGTEVQRPWRSVSLDRQRIALSSNLITASLQSVRNRCNVTGVGPSDRHLFAGNRSGNQKRPCFNTIWYDLMLGAV